MSIHEPDSAGNGFDPGAFAAAFQRFLAWTEANDDSREAPFRALLTDHFGTDPSEFPVTTESLGLTDLPNVQLALEELLGRPGVEHSLIGLGGVIEQADVSLSSLVADQAWGVRRGPVRRRVVELAGGRSLTCVHTGLYLVEGPEGPFALLISSANQSFGGPALRVEVMAHTEGAGDALIAELRRLMTEHNVYRGSVLVLDGGGDFGEEEMAIQFRDVPAVAREDIVLPQGVLDLVELHTVEFARLAPRLLEGGRHLRRGLLLHGPPGTGKTLTVSYLIRRLEGRTVIILSGNALSLVGEACALARTLAPSMVVLEDIDLVARERMMGGATSLLFELMNQIDGVGADSDVIFLMTTNRADVLEPALAARPGRVDQAVEIPLPDAAGRRKLVDLYCRGLDVDVNDLEPVLESTEGASAAFIRELVRKAALVAGRDESPTVGDEHFAEALDLLARGGAITRSMLGGDAGRAALLLDEDDGDWDEGEGWAPVAP